MVSRAVLFLFAFAAGFASSGSTTPTLEDLIAALNTTEKFWMNKRTYEVVGHTCVYSSLISLTQTDYEFNQYYKDGQQQEKGPNHLYGKLSTGEQGPIMTVSQQQGGQGIPYTLKFWNANEKCAILMLTKEGKPNCEQHVWNSQISSTFGACDEAFKESCPSSVTTQVYSASCQ